MLSCRNKTISDFAPCIFGKMTVVRCSPRQRINASWQSIAFSEVYHLASCYGSFSIIVAGLFFPTSEVYIFFLVLFRRIFFRGWLYVNSKYE